MPELRTEGPFIWVTWLSKLLAGDDNCEWASWFKTQFDGNSWTKVDRGSNLAGWLVSYTDLLNSRSRVLREKGYKVTREAQNHFTVISRVATISGKPDLIARQGNLVWIVDGKTGKPKTADLVQVMLYMHLLPMARPDLQGATIKGPGGLQRPRRAN